MNQDYTLQDCIKGFNYHWGDDRAMFVRRMESLSEWRTAAEYWKKLSRTSDANACIMIAEATERGDAYRMDAEQLNNWVEETVENGIMSQNEAVKFISPELNRIYRQHFPLTK